MTCINIHTYVALRTALWQASVKILERAEAGDLAIGLLEIRKAGSAYIKSFIKDIQWGSKNPVKKLKKLVASEGHAWEELTKELQTSAKDAHKEFEAAEKAMEDMLSATAAWTKHNVREGVNQTLSTSANITSAHSRVKSVINDIAEHLQSKSREKQAESRKLRTDMKRIAKCFEVQKLHTHWRSWLHTHNLMIDTDMPLDKLEQASKFSEYTPSCEAVGDSKQVDWSMPQWFTKDDEGNHTLYLIVIVSCNDAHGTVMC